LAYISTLQPWTRLPRCRVLHFVLRPSQLHNTSARVLREALSRTAAHHAFGRSCVAVCC
jgi:hypothetical protein